MKRSLMIATLLLLSAFAVSAQECDNDELTALYNKFLTNWKGPLVARKASADSGKEYLAKFGSCPGEHETKIAAYIKARLADYELAVAERDCTVAVDKTPARAFEVCEAYVTRKPESLRTHLLLSLAGIRKASEKGLNGRTVKAARRALELINAGQTVDPWFPGNTKEETVATLEFYSAYLTAEESPADAAATMLRLAHSESSYKKDPNTYFVLAKSLHSSEVKKELDDYNAKCGTEDSPDCDAAFRKIEGKIDRVIDAYARAVALAAGKPEHERVAAAAKPELVELWKTRHEDAGAGLDKFLAEILNKKLP